MKSSLIATVTDRVDIQPIDCRPGPRPPAQTCS